MNPAPRGAMLDRLTATDFEPLCGTPFVIEPGPGRSVATELLSVTSLREPPARADGSPRRRAFSLLFRTRTADRLPQQLYPLTHDRLGRLDVFLVPVGRDNEGLLLEAVFN